MFDTTGINNSNLVSPRQKYYPKAQYTLPPKKQRGIDTGRSPTKYQARTNTKSQYNGSKKGSNGTKVATAAVGGALVGAAAGVGAYQYANQEPTNEELANEQEIANIQAHQEDLEV